MACFKKRPRRKQNACYVNDKKGSSSCMEVGVNETDTVSTQTEKRAWEEAHIPSCEGCPVKYFWTDASAS